MLITPVVLVLLGTLAFWTPDLVPGLLATTDKGTLIGVALVVGLGAGLLEDLGWTGFALPRLQQHYGWLKAGLVLGLIWGLWHLLADYWGNANAWGPLYASRYLLWCGASFTAYRMLIAWAYSHTRSLLLAQLMHAGFTGGQMLLSPALMPSASSLVWYAAFAAILWLIVGLVTAMDGVGRSASSPLLVRTWLTHAEARPGSTRPQRLWPSMQRNPGEIVVHRRDYVPAVDGDQAWP